jgi:hypothetical protein
MIVKMGTVLFFWLLVPYLHTLSSCHLLIRKNGNKDHDLDGNEIELWKTEWLQIFDFSVNGVA